jgi:hypothetical protein
MVRCFGESSVNQQYGTAGAFERKFKKIVVQEDAIDFGCLGSRDQLKILTMLLASEKRRQTWKLLCKDALEPMLQSCVQSKRSAGIIAVNKQRIKQHLSGPLFKKNFGHCFLQQHCAVAQPVDSEIIARHFCTISRCRLLSTEQ